MEEAQRRIRNWKIFNFIQHLLGFEPPSLNLADLGLTELPELPSRVRYLDCSNNQLTRLPSELPSGLRILLCSENQLRSLPELPSGLTTLSCYTNQLTSLPELPSGLTTLSCSNNQLTSLPELPSGLTNLYCSNNQLTCLRELPSGIRVLSCSNNPLPPRQPGETLREWAWRMNEEHRQRKRGRMIHEELVACF